MTNSTLKAFNSKECVADDEITALTYDYYYAYLQVKPGFKLPVSDSNSEEPDWVNADHARMMDNPFYLWPIRPQIGITSKFTKENNLPDYYYQIVGTRINEERHSVYSLSRHTPSWTHLRDKAIYLNVGDLNACWVAAENIQAAWTDEVLIVDATDFNACSAIISHASAFSIGAPVKDEDVTIFGEGQVLEWGLDTHNPIKLQLLHSLILDQDDALIDEMLKEIDPASAMRFMANTNGSHGLKKKALENGEEWINSTMFKGYPSWFIKAYFLNKRLSKVIRRNFRHIIVVGAGKAIGREDFKTSKLFQYLAALGRLNTTVAFLD